MENIKKVTLEPISASFNEVQQSLTWDHLQDIPLTIVVELGDTAVKIGELLKVGKGTALTLNQLAGEPLKIKVNGKLFAFGEAVVIDDKMGVRILEIATPVPKLLI